MEDLPHLKYCGDVALQQIKHGRYFLREHPAGTQLDYINPWPEVQANETVLTRLMDKCMTGAKDEYGTPVEKTTEWTSNSATLLKPMQKYQCNKRHFHGTPTGKSLERLKTYPWKLCEVAVAGVRDLKAELKAETYPTVADSLPPVRVGHYPREPRAISTTHPSADISGYDAAIEEHAEVPDVPGDMHSASSARNASDAVRRRLPDWTRFNIQISLRNLRR